MYFYLILFYLILSHLLFLPHKVAFETALLTFTNHLEKSDRWTKIANEVSVREIEIGKGREIRRGIDREGVIGRDLGRKMCREKGIEVGIEIEIERDIVTGELVTIIFEVQTICDGMKTTPQFLY